MTNFRGIYSPRDRDTNVALIKNVLYAQNEENYRFSLKEFEANIHPSMYAELDWMERTMPQENRERAIEFVDGMFLNNLEKIVSLRQDEFRLNVRESIEEVTLNRDFYRFIIDQEPEIVNSFPEDLRKQIKDTYNAPPETLSIKETTLFEPENKRIRQLLNQIKDNEVLPLVVEMEIDNAVAKCLDHVSSRMRAKSYVRSLKNNFPQLNLSKFLTNEDLKRFVGQLEKIYSEAKKRSLIPLAVVCEIVLDYFDQTDVLNLTEFGGERAKGYGHCGQCSMMYSSTAIVSLDPTCPFLFEHGADRIYLPLDFNISVCPFCGYKSRNDAPAMFYSPSRNQVIYCVPTLGQFTEAQAEDVHKPVIDAIRERYKEKIGALQAAAFENANEEVTYDSSRFILAIQMGTANLVHHAFNRVSLADGSALIVDPTTQVMVELITPTEVHNMWDLEVMSCVETVDNKGEKVLDAELLTNAISAFSEGDYLKAKELLEREYERNPKNNMVKKNLAVAYLSLGDKESAQNVLQS